MRPFAKPDLRVLSRREICGIIAGIRQNKKRKTPVCKTLPPTPFGRDAC